jgi:hypothetical protein
LFDQFAEVSCDAAEVVRYRPATLKFSCQQTDPDVFLLPSLPQLQHVDQTILETFIQNLEKLVFAADVSDVG